MLRWLQNYKRKTEVKQKLGKGKKLQLITKTGEKIVYSRGIPSEICKELPPSDIVDEFLDFITKYALFDDVIDWERDVKDYGKKKKEERQRRQI